MAYPSSSSDKLKEVWDAVWACIAPSRGTREPAPSSFMTQEDAKPYGAFIHEHEGKWYAVMLMDEHERYGGGWGSWAIEMDYVLGPYPSEEAARIAAKNAN